MYGHIGFLSIMFRKTSYPCQNSFDYCCTLLTFPARCPNSAPYATVRGHYCCALPLDDGDCQVEKEGDLVPCRDPPCKTNKAKVVTFPHLMCPEERPYAFSEGQLCCKHSVAADACNATRMGWQTEAECCRLDEFSPCEHEACFDHWKGQSNLTQPNTVLT